MKIIKKGIDPKAYPIEFTCTNCGTIWEATQTEAQKIDGNQREAPYWSHNCPVCCYMCSSTKRGKEPLIEEESATVAMHRIHGH